MTEIFKGRDQWKMLMRKKLNLDRPKLKYSRAVIPLQNDPLMAQFRCIAEEINAKFFNAFSKNNNKSLVQK